MSQERLAELTRLTRVHVSRIENDHHVPKPETVRAIAEALQCPESLLVDDEEERALTVDPRDFGTAMSQLLERAVEQALASRLAREVEVA